MNAARTPKRVGPPAVDDLGTVHRPIETEPFRLRPDGGDADHGYYRPADAAADQNLWSDPPEQVEVWRDRTRAARLALLTEALHEVQPTEYELRQLTWLCGWETSTVVVTASLLDRAYRAGLAAGRAKRRPAR